MANQSKKNTTASTTSSKSAMEKFKTEVASELGVNLKDGYNGNLSSKEAGSIGGEMVKRMVKERKNQMK